jgi:hypothetical protein
MKHKAGAYALKLLDIKQQQSAVEQVVLCSRRGNLEGALTDPALGLAPS